MNRAVVLVLGTLLSAATAAPSAGQKELPLIVAFITASVTTFSTAEGKLPRYTPIGILRLGASTIWVMSQWGIESQTIVLFEISARGVRTLTSADISGC